MTTKPRKTASEPQPSRGYLELRNRLIMAVVIMIGAGALLWKPWASPTVTVAASPTRAVALVAPPHANAPASKPAAEPAQPSPLFTTASISPPLPPSALRMSPSLEADFDAWLIESYRACWSPPGATPDGDPYYPRVRVALKVDGTLASQPKLVNPPNDPAWKPHAEAAVRAVKSCDPLKVPDKFAPYYTQWKTKTVFFDPTRS